jgi:ribosomal subunit interface protein
MQLPLQITFRDVPPSDSVAAYVRKHVAKLEKFFDRITSCRVVIEAPTRAHHRHGAAFRILIDIAVPGDVLIVGRKPEDEASQLDIYAAIDSSFDDMKRRLDEWARIRRGGVKFHARPSVP